MDKVYTLSLSWEYFWVICYCLFTTIFGPLLGIWIVLFILFYTKFYILSVIYICWIVYDSCNLHVDRRWSYIRSLNAWKTFSKYFPLSLVKTEELDPGKNYIFCVFPHGIIPFGLVQFVTDVSSYNELYPGIKCFPCTSLLGLLFPIARELLRLLGGQEFQKKHLNVILNKPNGGNAALVSVGGALEVALSRPKTYKIYLKKRRGFIRLALNHGASLVPVIQFGINDLYQQVPIPDNRVIQFLFKIYQKISGLTAIPSGRLLFYIAYPKAVTVVVGPPLQVEHVPNPTKDKIQEVHAEFEKCLIKLFESEKHKYVCEPEKTFLEIF